MYVPSDHSPAKGYPLFIGLHEGGGLSQWVTYHTFLRPLTQRFACWHCFGNIKRIIAT